MNMTRLWWGVTYVEHRTEMNPAMVGNNLESNVRKRLRLVCGGK